MLGLMLESSESESSWRAFFAWLKQRGLSGVDIVVSDRHGGLVKAL
ncbi:MAG: DNA polymerase IV [Hydrogenibacillus schlegelii]|nr:MAG: DNA polymerase IV [Hydrogenibacillus schlegelii]